jgi:hypothetical protein
MAVPSLVSPEMYRFGALSPGAGCVVHVPMGDILLGVERVDSSGCSDEVTCGMILMSYVLR